MKHILVPFGSFKGSLRAIDYAAMLSTGTDVQITALHFVDPSNYKSKEAFEFEVKKITELEVRPRLIEASKLNPNLKKIKLEVMALQSDIADGILKFADKNLVDFIIMGSHGLPEPEKREKDLKETNSYKVVLGAHCPVFTFTKLPTTLKIQRIALPLDLSEGTRAKIPLAIKFAGLFKASIHLLSISEDLDDSETTKLRKLQTEVYEQIQKEKIKVDKVIVESDDLPSALLEFSETISADLIIMMNRPKSLWNDLFISPSSQRIISFSKTPVLSMRGRDRNTTA